MINHRILWVIKTLCRELITTRGTRKKTCFSYVCNPNLATWILQEKSGGDIRGRAEAEMREWIRWGVTGEEAGTAESSDSTEEEEPKTDLGFICISNSPGFLPAMSESCWCSLRSSVSSHFISLSPFSSLTAGFLLLSLLHFSRRFGLIFLCCILNVSMCYPLCIQ